MFISAILPHYSTTPPPLITAILTIFPLPILLVALTSRLRSLICISFILVQLPQPPHFGLEERESLFKELGSSFFAAKLLMVVAGACFGVAYLG
jgi:hypothetical protein